MSEQPPKHSPEKIQIDRINYSDFSKEDQRLMKSGEWDPQNPELVLNKMKAEIEALDDSSLSEQELSDKDNALWLWYHHGSQFAYAKYHDTETAIAYIDKALEYREKIGLDNQITPLLKMLYTGNLVEARTFAESLPKKVLEKNTEGIEEEVDNVEYETALLLVGYFEDKEKK